MKKIGDMERKREEGVGISHSLLENPKNPKYENEIQTTEGDAEKREKSEICHSYIKNLALETARISHSKTPNNTCKDPTTQEDNRKHPKITAEMYRSYMEKSRKHKYPEKS